MKKVVLVTGSAKSIGRHIAIKFAKEGYDVIINDVANKEAAEETKKIVEDNGAQATILYGDISNEESVLLLKKQVEEKYGYLTTLVNNAGIVPYGFPPDDLSKDNWDKVINVNLNGTYLMIKNFLPLLKKADNPSIINIASTAAFTGGSGSIAYAASKGGVVSLTRALARVFGPEGIRVNGVAPTLIITDMMKDRFKDNPEGLEKKLKGVPLRRFCKEEEVAEITYFLSKPLYIHGQVIIADGGREVSV